MKSRIVRAVMIAVVTGLIALAGTAPLGKPNGWNSTTSVETGG